MECESQRVPATNEPAIVKLALNEPVNFGATDSLMSEVTYKLMCGMSLPNNEGTVISVIMFSEIFAVSTGYYARDISDGYAKFLKGAE